MKDSDIHWERILGNLERNGITLNVAMCCDSEFGVRAAVRTGVGLGILCHEVIAPDLRKGDLKIIKITGLKTRGR